MLSAPNLATFEAWQLSLWYQELALLSLLGHHGEYRNRLTAEWLGQLFAVAKSEPAGVPFRDRGEGTGEA